MSYSQDKARAYSETVRYVFLSLFVFNLSAISYTDIG